MKVLVFGVNGGIGTFVVRYALESGCEVVAYVRRIPPELIWGEHVELVVGNTDDTGLMTETMCGCDAVINCIGVSMRPFYEDQAAVEANRNIISAMKKVGVCRYITWATPSVRSQEDVRSYVTLFPGLMASIFLPGAKKCISSIVADIVDSGLRWTVIRFVAPKNSTPTGNVTVSFGDIRLRFNIARADIAAFMVAQLTSDEFVCRMPIIGS